MSDENQNIRELLYVITHKLDEIKNDLGTIIEQKALENFRKNNDLINSMRDDMIDNFSAISKDFKNLSIKYDCTVINKDTDEKKKTNMEGNSKHLKSIKVLFKHMYLNGEKDELIKNGLFTEEEEVAIISKLENDSKYNQKKPLDKLSSIASEIYKILDAGKKSILQTIKKQKQDELNQLNSNTLNVEQV